MCAIHHYLSTNQQINELFKQRRRFRNPYFYFSPVSADDRNILADYRDMTLLYITLNVFMRFLKKENENLQTRPKSMVEQRTQCVAKAENNDL